MEKGMIFDIQKFSLHDGPGIRTTVFFKGCNMNCRWCHNPESLKRTPQVFYNENICAHCMACAAVCKTGANIKEGERHRLRFEKCEACGKCEDACVYTALKMAGREMTVDAVMKEIMSDLVFYEHSGGGATFSGGEPTLQPGFLLALLRECKNKGVHTCLDTNGVTPPDILERLIDLTDLFLLDYKITGEEAHVKYTGQPLKAVMDSLELLESRSAKVILRCPIIPGINDDEKHRSKINELKEKFTCVQSAEDMEYHELGRGKWKAIGLTPPKL